MFGKYFDILMRKNLKIKSKRKFTLFSFTMTVLCLNDTLLILFHDVVVRACFFLTIRIPFGPIPSIISAGLTFPTNKTGYISTR